MACPVSHQKRGKKQFPAVPGTNTPLCSSPYSNFLEGKREVLGPRSAKSQSRKRPLSRGGRGEERAAGDGGTCWVVLRLPRLKAESVRSGVPCPEVLPSDGDGEGRLEGRAWKSSSKTPGSIPGQG